SLDYCSIETIVLSQSLLANGCRYRMDAHTHTHTHNRWIPMMMVVVCLTDYSLIGMTRSILTND
ncbi:hypothetical protein RDWZM_008160, partial [Blomia tropicalis]